MVRLIGLILIIAFSVAMWHTFKPSDFSKDNIEAKMKQEKTINTVQQAREKRRLEAEKVMDQF